MDIADKKKYQPYLLPMNSEESQRYNGIRQALLDRPPGFVDTLGVGRQYGVMYPTLPEKEDQQRQPNVQPDITSGVPDDGMPVDPNDGGMPGAMPSMAMPQPGILPQANQMLQPGAMQNPMQNPMQKRGLGALMARLSGRPGGGF